MSWIRTYTGHRFWPLNPNADDVRIEDIAHPLSQVCRWTGHTREFYSVAQHSVHVSEHCDPADALWGLLHDATEAYLADLARPVKHDPRMRVFTEVEDQLMLAIAAHFGLPGSIPESVHIADDRMLATESRDLLAPVEDEPNDFAPPYPELVEPWPPTVAERVFLARFTSLVLYPSRSLHSFGPALG